MPSIIRPFLTMLANAAHADLARQIQYLRAENQILRGRLPRRLKVTHGERAKLVRYGRPLGRAVFELASIVKPGTFRKWLNGKPAVKVKAPGRGGRPRKPKEIRELVVRLARETGWGYGRILGELRKLGIHSISKPTIRAILREHAIDPAPKRGEQTWDEFLKQHTGTLWACDFFTTKAWTWKGLIPYFTLVFIHIQSRRVIVSRSTTRPDQAWVLAQAEHFAAAATDETTEPPTMLLRDSDSKFGRAFDEALAQHNVSVKRLPYRSPQLNAFVERWIRSVRYECLEHFVILGRRHLDHLVAQFVRYYHHERPHQGIGNRLLIQPSRPPPEDGPIVAHRRLGGLLVHYERKAA